LDSSAPDEGMIQITHPELRAHTLTMEAAKSCKVHAINTRLNETVYGFHFTCKEATATVLYAHGNAMDCAALLGFWREFSTHLKVNIFALEYSGYGHSTGEPSVNNTYADIEAAYDYLIAELGCTAEQIILYGQSVGSGPVCYLGTVRACKGVVLHCALMTGLQTIFGPPTCCSPTCIYGSCDIYKNVELVEKIDCPVFVIHGTHDEVIDWHHGKELHARAKNKVNPYWVHGGKHNDVVEVNPRLYFERVRLFLVQLGATTARPIPEMEIVVPASSTSEASTAGETEMNPASKLPPPRPSSLC